MKVENIDKADLSKLSDKELLNLRDRSNQVFKNCRTPESVAGFRNKIVTNYSLLMAEISKRDIDVTWTSDLDKIIFKARFSGVDHNKLQPIVLKSGFISLWGDYIENPVKNTDEVRALIKSNNTSLYKRINNDIVNQLMESTNSEAQKIRFEVKPDMESWEELPLFDLVLVPTAKRERITYTNKSFKSQEPTDITELFNLPLKFKKNKTVEFSKTSDDEGIVGAIVYRASNNEQPWVDSDGEWTDKETLQTAAYDYMEKSQKILQQHEIMKGEVPAYVIESFVTDYDTKKKIDDNNDYNIPANSWWLAIKIDKETDEGADIWERIKSGEITGFSFGGMGFSEEKDPSEE